MARLVAVCRDGEEEFPFEKRQIPLYIDDTLTVSAETPPPQGVAVPGRGLHTRGSSRGCSCQARPRGFAALCRTFLPRPQP